MTDASNVWCAVMFDEEGVRVRSYYIEYIIFIVIYTI